MLHALSEAVLRSRVKQRASRAREQLPGLGRAFRREFLQKEVVGLGPLLDAGFVSGLRAGVSGLLLVRLALSSFFLQLGLSVVFPLG